MLCKANRFWSGKDLYNPGAHVLKTLTRNEETHRVCDIKPGAKGVMSIYDEIHHEKAAFVYERHETTRGGGTKTVSAEANGAPRGLLYNAADALEDEVLFPEERSADGTNSATGRFELLKTWEEEGFSLRKFIEGWDSDSDLDELGPDEDKDEESDEESDDDDDDDDNYHYVHEGEDEDEWEDEERHSDSKGNKNSRVTTNGRSRPPLPAMIEEMLQEMIEETDPSKNQGLPTEEEFIAYLEKEQAKTFKEIWHKSDTEPHAQIHYIEMKQLVKKSLKFNARDIYHPSSILTFTVVKWLGVVGDEARDVWKAVAKLSPFMYPDFFQSELGEAFKDSLLFNQEERAKNLPDIRGWVSNTTRPKEFWREWDIIEKDPKKGLDDTPIEWDMVIRPIIARCKSTLIFSNIGSS